MIKFWGSKFHREEKDGVSIHNWMAWVNSSDVIGATHRIGSETTSGTAPTREEARAAANAWLDLRLHCPEIRK